MAAAMFPPPGTIELADPTPVRRPHGHWSGCSVWSRTAALLSCPLGGADTIAAETCGVVRATSANAPSPRKNCVVPPSARRRRRF